MPAPQPIPNTDSKSGNAQSLQSRYAGSQSLDWSTRSRVGQGRPLVSSSAQQPYSIRGRKFSPTATIEPPDPATGGYRESGARLVDRQEASSLREALEEIDLKDEEKRIHAAAQNEAADLVWKHRNPKSAEKEKAAAYPNPDLAAKRQSLADLPPSLRIRGPESAGRSDIGRAGVLNSGVRKSSGKRRVSSGTFPNAGEKIHEDSVLVMEPDSIKPTTVSFAPGPLKVTNRNSVRGARPLPGRPGAEEKRQRFNPFEIHKNPPSQSRNAVYAMNTTPPAVNTIPEVNTPPSKNGIEIRGDDIRAATSMRRKDRSPKLPLPTAVSDTLGRPIVSFDPSWKQERTPSKDEMDEEMSPSISALPEIQIATPEVPVINISPDPLIRRATEPSADQMPTISISTNDQPASKPPSTTFSGRPLPQPKLQPRSQSAPKPSSRLPWLNATSQPSLPTATCASCNLPISGRIVTASGAGQASSIKARFHPECFSCHHCSTPLECVAFYPEPEDARHARLSASEPSENPVDAAEEANELRFYCHLDFHEFFSPRCKNCKTPIEGEVIVAAGAEWHVGHFFCSECGDPFDARTPFVEKDGYAYCVGCHTKRTAARCRGCRKQVLEEVTVRALGGEWHEGCFRCWECQGGFGKEGRFFVRVVRVEGTEKEKRRGVRERVEDRAVCVRCEERRLKA